MEEIKSKIRAFMNPILKGHELDDYENIFELGLANSLFAMQIILFIEKEFRVELEPDEMQIDELSSVDAISEIVYKKLTAIK